MLAPSEKEKAKEFWQRAKGYLREWPDLLKALFQNSQTALRTLPQSGSWERPLVYFATAGLAAGLFQLVMFSRMLPGSGIGLLVQGFISIFVGGFLFSAILHFLLSAFATSPGYYRTTYFMSLLCISSPLAILLSGFHPIFGLAIGLAVLYAIYMFSQEIAGLSKQKAAIFVIILCLLMALLGMAAVPKPGHFTLPAGLEKV